MATEKQIWYIKKLIEERRPENMPWWNREVGGVNQEDIERGHRIHDGNRREWVLGTFDVNPFAVNGVTFEQAERAYTKLLDFLSSDEHLGSLDTKQASTLIDQLKRNGAYGKGHESLLTGGENDSS